MSWLIIPWRDLCKWNWHPNKHIFFQQNDLNENQLESVMLVCSWLYPDSKVHGANMGPTWVLSAPDGPHVCPMNLAIWVVMAIALYTHIPIYNLPLTISTDHFLVLYIHQYIKETNIQQNIKLNIRLHRSSPHIHGTISGNVIYWICHIMV